MARGPWKWRDSASRTALVVPFATSCHILQLMAGEGLSEDEQRRLDAFLQLTRIERGLRRMLETTLSTTDGPGWIRALPNDIRQKVEGPGIDYADFPDLKKIIASSWRKLGDIPRGVAKQQAIVHLEGLEEIRNDLAHSRDISSGALKVVEAAYFVLTPLHCREDRPDAQSLPPTKHRSVAISRLVSAITHSGEPSPADVNVLQTGGPASDAVSAYSRVRDRPGRSACLMREVQERAISALAEELLSSKEPVDL